MKFLNKTIPYIFVGMFSIVLILIYFFSNIDYYIKRTFLLPNISLLLIIVTIFLIYYFKYKDKKDITNKKFNKILLILSLVVFILQIILTYNIYFFTDWDVKVIRDIVDYYIQSKTLSYDYYLSIYPNNLFLTFILATIKKLPIIGTRYFTTLAINCLVVNLSGVFAALTIKNFTNKRSGLLSYFIMTPLVLLSPWIVIPYTDTLAAVFPIAVIYFYTKKEKKHLDLFLIPFLAFIGYFIKPTVIIVLMAIIIVEIFARLKEMIKVKEFIKNYAKNIGILILGVLIALIIKKGAIYTLHFEKQESIQPFTFIHYLAMGQNNKTLGVYDEDDIKESAKYGKKRDIDKFIKRATSRSIPGQISFYSKKTLLNFNDGSFSWGKDGSFFYEMVNKNTKLSNTLRSFYYKDGKNYDYFLLISQLLWLLVLTFIPFVYKKNNTKNELVLMLSLIGITLFLTIFEPRTRYLYCFSPVFVTAFVIGIRNLREKLKYGRKNKEVKNN